MKTKLALALLLCSNLLVTGLFSQQNTTPPPADGGPRITITKRTTEPDGTVTTETIVKKGQAARNFNFDEYLKDNKADNVSLDIQSEGGDEERHVTINGAKSGRGSLYQIEREVRDAVNETWNWTEEQIRGIEGGGDRVVIYKNSDYEDGCGAFLGVEEDSDEDEDEAGVVVEVVRGSAADQAGLRNNDLILSLNDQKINRWSDLSKVIQAAKPGDALRIVYRRNKEEKSTTATLTTRSAARVNENDDEKQGFLGVTEMDDDEERAGVSVSITTKSGAEKAGLRNGDVILQLNDTQIDDFEDVSDFMEYTKPGETIKVTYERGGQRSTVDATLGEQQDWNWNSSWNNSQNWNLEEREKEACLGVYTSTTFVGDAQRGANITGFTQTSAAEDASLKTGDVITAVDGNPVADHESLWNAIAKRKSGDKVKVEYLRGDQTLTKEIELRPCEGRSSQVKIMNSDDQGNGQERQFFTWNWDQSDRDRLRERRTITIHKGVEGDTPVDNTAGKINDPVPADRRLELSSFKAYPNPSGGGPITIEFRAEPKPITVSLYDLSGRQLFQEEMNAFGGEYIQQFDLSEYAKGAVVVRIQQGDRLFSEKILVN